MLPKDFTSFFGSEQPLLKVDLVEAQIAVGARNLIGAPEPHKKHKLPESGTERSIWTYGLEFVRNLEPRKTIVTSQS